MLKPVIVLQLVMLYLFGTDPTVSALKMVHRADAYQNVLALNLTCKSDTHIVYVNQPSGVTVCAEELITGLDTMAGCSIVSITMDDGNTVDSCITYGVNDIFAPPFKVKVLVMDICGNLDSCCTVVNIVDTIPPQIICPQSDTVCDFSLVPASFISASSFVVGGGSITDNTFDPMQPLPPGIFSLIATDTIVDNCMNVINRSYRVIDYEGLADTCIHSIYVQNNFNINCDSVVTVRALTDSCYGYFEPDISIPDNCNIDTTFNDGPNNNQFAVGDNLVNYTYISVCNDTVICSTIISVLDVQPPSITCPTDITVQCTLPTPVTSVPDFIALGGSITDNCLVYPDIENFTSTSSTECPFVFNQSYIAYDFDNNADTCTYRITQYDTNTPELTCIHSYSVNTASGLCTGTINLIQATATDNCGVGTIYHSGAVNNTYPIGDTYFYWTAIDNCENYDTCNVIVHVIDNQPATATMIVTQTTPCNFNDVPQWASINDYTNAGGIVTDNCTGPLTISFVNQTPISVDTLKRNYNINDGYGNLTMVMQQVVIVDNTPPTVIAPNDVTITCIQNKDNLALTGDVNVDDDCDPDPATGYNDTLMSGPCPKVYRRVWEAEDAMGNIGRDTQLITQVDNIRPVFNSVPASLANIQCSSPFPAQETLTATDLCTPPAVVTKSILPYVTNTCNGYTVVYVWTATDGCNNSSSQSISFNVLPDTQGPTLADPADVTVNNAASLCNATLNLSTPSSADNCSGSTVTRIPSGNVFNVGATIVTWTATDACGNSSSQTQSITVRDTEAPNIICKGSRDFDLSYGVNQLPATYFLTSYVDNCPGALIVKARRMDTRCAANADIFGDNVTFCCADVGLTVPVIVQVTDQAGNHATCMVQINVKDKLPPVLEMDLRDITISCDYPLDLANLSAFGTYRFAEADRQIIDIDDDLFDLLPGVFKDGLIVDNCSPLTLTPLTPLDLRNVHHLGDIIRRWTVNDPSNNSITLDQKITIVDADPLTKDDIHWPLDASYTDCKATPPLPAITGSPTFDADDICTIPAASYKDQIFDDPTEACLLIRRKWKVIDWAQYVPNTTQGIWEHTQNIKLINTVKPVLTTATCTNKNVCAVNSECDALVKLGAHATDDCTEVKDLRYDYKIDLNSDGTTELSAITDTFAIRMNRGVHTIVWRVDDKCGNLSTCSHTVVVKECKAPVPVCMNGLTTNLVNEGTSVVWAKDFDLGSYDNCTAKPDLKISFSQNVNDTGKTLTCADKGNKPIEIWVTDQDGNKSKCNTFILVTDLEHKCPTNTTNSNTINLAGRLATEENYQVSEVQMIVKYDNLESKLMSDSTGNYFFKDLDMYKSYNISAFKNDDIKQGISTLDLVLIQRHILNVKKITSPYKLISADVNNDQRISASDLVEMRKVILGINDKFSNNTSWRFVDKKFVFADPNSPWPFKEQFNYDSLDQNMLTNDFVAVKIGDIDGTAYKNLKSSISGSRSREEIYFKIEDKVFESDKYVNVPLYIGEYAKISGFQMQLKFDRNKVDFQSIMNEGVELNNDQYFYNEETGILTIAYSNAKDLELNSGNVLFTLQLRSKESDQVSHAVSLFSTNNAELYSDDYSIKSIRFNFENNNEALQVSQNNPNPFSAETEVKFYLIDEGSVDVSIYDQAGKLVYNALQKYAAGMNKLMLGKEQLGDNYGIFLLHISTGEQKEIRKMIRIR